MTTLRRKGVLPPPVQTLGFSGNQHKDFTWVGERRLTFPTFHLALLQKTTHLNLSHLMNKKIFVLIYTSLISRVAPMITHNLYFFFDKKLFINHSLKHLSIKGGPSQKKKIRVFPTDSLS